MTMGHANSSLIYDILTLNYLGDWLAYHALRLLPHKEPQWVWFWGGFLMRAWRSFEIGLELDFRYPCVTQVKGPAAFIYPYKYVAEGFLIYRDVILPVVDFDRYTWAMMTDCGKEVIRPMEFSFSRTSLQLINCRMLLFYHDFYYAPMHMYSPSYNWEDSTYIFAACRDTYWNFSWSWPILFIKNLINDSFHFVCGIFLLLYTYFFQVFDFFLTAFSIIYKDCINGSLHLQWACFIFFLFFLLVLFLIFFFFFFFFFLKIFFFFFFFFF